MAKRMLSEAEGYDLLREYGVPTPGFEIVTNADAAAKAASAIGFPVVMKVVSPQIVHKSDAGGVVVGISGAAEAKKAFTQIVDSAKEYDPEAEVKGVIVEEMAQPGLELILGGKTDPAFGKVITFGMGGTLVELMKDVTLRIVPVSEEEIRTMVREINAYPLIAGYRGMKPRDEEALVEIIAGVARFFEENPQVTEFDINPLRLYESGACAVDARIIVDEDLKPVERRERTFVPPEYFTPRSVAVIGASSNPQKMGYAVLHNLLHFPGQIYPVNNKRTEVQGLKAYPNVTAIPNPIDLAVITVPAVHVPRVMQECGEKKIPLVVVITAGFKEAGEEGKVLEERMLDIARHYHIRVVGPNCLGLIIPPRGLDTTYVHESPKPGSVAFISQSGAIINTVVDWSLKQDIGFSAVFSVGNQADLDFLDYLRFVEQDKSTRAIILYIEQLTNGREFMEVVSEVAKKKPVVAIKSGSSQKGQKAASSHTGSLSGSYEVYMEAFREAGVIPVRALRGAFEVAELCASPGGYPKGRRAIVITNAGGFAVLSSDYAEMYGLDLIDLPPAILNELNEILPDYWSHANPLDLLGDASEKRFQQVFEVLARHSDLWDIAFVVGFPNLVLDSESLAHQIINFSGKTENLVVGTLLGGECMDAGIKILKDHDIPNFDELEQCFKVVGRVVWQRCRAKSIGLP
ncbi:acetyl coenzyme A synthetase (ADP forming)-like protein [Methanofollis sp. W23]|uniref:acetate--CoA ligase family protein n=1 Tax=Methanofollis sp. W23 TaxID=2817849 RepID=UPI001AE89F2B|nr:acetate--CoA ligase family protein [Methanofollis sp. W23]MBP2145859.1 acetyl coenzyme A synthetase (ADP forming)-like protein [Methanofollis sp. W23]